MSLEQPCSLAENTLFQLAGIKLLVVDDNLDTRTLFAFVLESYGAEVIAVTSAEEALASLRQTRPDLLISDINLTGEDGYSLIQKIRCLNSEQGGQIPAIAVTGLLSEPGFNPHSTKFQLHLTKPVDIDELVRAAVALTR
ncbi:MAG: response regulator [Cyanobacteria bacterium J069]|nr:MAG: response regulator [Cyanobacteria bacterium J069]